LKELGGELYVANEPKRPKIIKEKSSIFDMPTGAERSSPEVIVLELMRTLFFDKSKSAKSQFLDPDLEGFSEEEILAIKSFQGRRKNLNRKNSKLEYYYSPVYPWLARKSHFRNKDPNIIDGFFLKGPIAHSLKTFYFKNKSKQEEVVEEFSNLFVNSLLGESDNKEINERKEVFAACIGEHEFNKTDRIDSLKETILDHIDNTQLLPCDGNGTPTNFPSSFDDLNFLLKAEQHLPRQHWILMLTCYLRLIAPLWCISQSRSTIFLRDWILDSLSGIVPSQEEIENRFKKRSQKLLCPSERWGPFLEEHIVSYMKARIQISSIIQDMNENGFLDDSFVATDKPITVCALEKAKGLYLIDFLQAIESARDRYKAFAIEEYKLTDSNDFFQTLSGRLGESYNAWNDKKKGQQKNLRELMLMFRTSDSKDERGSHLVEASKNSNDEVRIIPGQMTVQVFVFFADNLRRHKQKRGELVLSDLISHFKGYGIDYEGEPDGIKILSKQVSDLGLLAGSPDAGKSAKLINPYKSITKKLFSTSQS
jgi:hypothetical protein